MFDHVLTGWIPYASIITAVTGMILLFLGAYVKERAHSQDQYHNLKDFIKNYTGENDPEDNKPRPQKSTGSTITIITGTLLALTGIIALVTTHHIRGEQINTAIEQDLKDQYGITAYPQTQDTPLSFLENEPQLGDILDNQPHPITVEYNGKFYKNTYLITYDHEEDHVDLHYDHGSSNDPENKPPSPRELKEVTRQNTR